MKKHLGTILSIIIGAACGAFGAAAGIRFLPESVGIDSALIALGVIVISVFAHIILHEGGHLVCGLLSGYKFVSFRVGSLMLLKRNGSYLLKKFHIPGTGGQCLLDPPEPVDGKYPVKLYNLGGGIANLLFSVLAILPLLGDERHPYVTIFCLIFSLLGVVLALTNLIPLKVSGIANDGYNILSLDKDPVGREAFWQQMRVNRLSTDGVRLKDMDESHFDLAQSDVEGNPLIDQIKFFWFQRLIDGKRFEEAREYGRKLMHGKDSIPIFKLMVGVELLYLELIGPCDVGVVNALYSKAIQKWMKAVKGYPSTHRVKYAYAVRFAHDEKMASKAAEDFAKTIKTYPMAGEIETEKELLEEVKG